MLSLPFGKLVLALFTQNENCWWESAYLDQKLLTSERAKARKAVEIAETEQVIKELEKRKVDLLSQFLIVSLSSVDKTR